MKKLTLLSAALLAGGLWCANAQLNNPVGEDGYYIVRWDCANDTWAAANDFEVDETFTIAVDVTGTPLETWLKGTCTDHVGATRAIAINRWSNMGDFGTGDCNRLKQIKGNIYGATYNFAQLGELGTFGISLTCEGAETLQKFTADNIIGVNILFTPGVDFENLRSRAEFAPVSSRAAQLATYKAERAGESTVDLEAAKRKPSHSESPDEETGTDSPGNI